MLVYVVGTVYVVMQNFGDGTEFGWVLCHRVCVSEWRMCCHSSNLEFCDSCGGLNLHM